MIYLLNVCNPLYTKQISLLNICNTLWEGGRRESKVNWYRKRKEERERIYNCGTENVRGRKTYRERLWSKNDRKVQ